MSCILVHILGTYCFHLNSPNEISVIHFESVNNGVIFSIPGKVIKKRYLILNLPKIVVYGRN